MNTLCTVSVSLTLTQRISTCRYSVSISILWMSPSCVKRGLPHNIFLDLTSGSIRALSWTTKYLFHQNISTPEVKCVKWFLFFIFFFFFGFLLKKSFYFCYKWTQIRIIFLFCFITRRYFVNNFFSDNLCLNSERMAIIHSS